MNTTIKIDIFKKRLAETIAWCSKRVKDEPTDKLRSSELRPPGWRLNHRLNLQLCDVVEAIVAERAYCVQNWADFREHKTAEGLAGGRLLFCTSATMSIPDGYVTQASNGFYDEDDMPPWDTWLCYWGTERHYAAGNDKRYQIEYLVSWVPASLIELANVGVEKHFMDCMSWAAKENEPFSHQLRFADLME